MDERSRHVLVSVPEQILILRSYKKNGDNWPQVYREVLQSVGRLSWKAQNLYKENSYAQIQKRMPDQVLNTRRAYRKRRIQISCAFCRRKWTTQSTWEMKGTFSRLEGINWRSIKILFFRYLRYDCDLFHGYEKKSRKSLPMHE